jgi:hypothetical protein
MTALFTLGGSVVPDREQQYICTYELSDSNIAKSPDFLEVRGKAGVFDKLPTNLRRNEIDIVCNILTPIVTFMILVKFRTLRTNLPLQGNKLGISKNGY